MAHSISAQYSKTIKRTVCEEAMGSKRGEFLLEVDDTDILRILLGLVQIFSDKTATSLKCSALAAYPVHVVCLNLTAKQRRYSTGHGHTVLSFLPAWSRERWKQKEGTTV